MNTLERNLAALAQRNPGLAARVRATPARADVTFCPTDDGVPSATFADGRALASRRRPKQEAERWAAPVDLIDAAVFVVHGFGLGHHVAALAARLQRHGLIVVLEPDTGLLRAALERIECPWLATSAVVVIDDPEDVTALNRGISGLEAFVALGVSLLDHPPSMARLGDAPARFSQTVARLVKATRTHLATTLVQSEVTLRNELMNADKYVTSKGIADLKGVMGRHVSARSADLPRNMSARSADLPRNVSARSADLPRHVSARSADLPKPAIVVSAGPSLGRNLDLLSRPGVRDRFVIIAVQTVLKTLLERGIRPHYVTALDHHEISRRFYEGLTEADVAGVELIVEPKANAAILEAFPGVIRCAADERLDRVLGEGLAEDKGEIEPGATVAHLAYTFARHLGCDPVILIGQDLGFTDGHYYAPGAAIHNVWASELNPFRTLEMFEWERIARGRHLLSRVEDQRGGTMYTDEQMGSYLVQFERMFAADAERGLTTIDATEGGAKKRSTQVMPLAEALERFGAEDLTTARPQDLTISPSRDARTLTALDDRLRFVRKQAGRIKAICTQTSALMESLGKFPTDAAAAKELRQIDALRREVEGLEPAYGLVQFIAQAAALQRIKADRAMALATDLDEAARRARRIDRDSANVRWLGEAAERVSALLETAIAALKGGPKLTRDPISQAEAGAGPVVRGNVRAVIAFEPSHEEVAPWVLELTLQRLARTRELDGVIVLTREPERVRKLLPEVAGLRLEVIENEVPVNAARTEAVHASRIFAEACWRSALGNLTCYDEVCNTAELAPVMADLGLDAAVVLGANWCFVDPALTDDIVRAHRSAPGSQQLVFTQAAPGLAPALVGRGLIEDLARQQHHAGPLATIGGLLGYAPSMARPDPITKAGCVSVPTALRDLHVRCIPDTRARTRAMADALATLGSDPARLPTLAMAEAFAARLRPLASPSHVTVELCTGRRIGGLRAAWLHGPGEPPERPAMSEALARRCFSELNELRSGMPITFGGAGDPLHHPRWAEMVRLARSSGLGPAHLRTDLLCEAEELGRLVECGASIISVDLLAHSRAAFARLSGLDAFDRVRSNTERLVALARQRWQQAGGLGVPWIVPRITRCEAAAGEIEAFYDHWLSQCGAAVIDALPREVAGERFAPLPVPALAMDRLSARAMTVRSDGSIVIGGRVAGHLERGGLAEAWKRTRRAQVSTFEAEAA